MEQPDPAIVAEKIAAILTGNFSDHDLIVNFCE
jgi:hypothetical protein